MPGCELCKLGGGVDHGEKVFYEDSVCVVVLCRTCHVPMAVLKRHTSTATCREAIHLVRALQKLYPGRRIDFKMRSIPEHYHLHVR